MIRNRIGITPTLNYIVKFRLPCSREELPSVHLDPGEERPREGVERLGEVRQTLARGRSQQDQPLTGLGHSVVAGLGRVIIMMMINDDDEI